MLHKNPVHTDLEFQFKIFYLRTYHIQRKYQALLSHIFAVVPRNWKKQNLLRNINGIRRFQSMGDTHFYLLVCKREFLRAKITVLVIGAFPNP